VKYSYIKPRKKSFFTKEFQLVFVFFSVSFIMLTSVYLFLIFKDERFSTRIQEAKELQERINNNVKKMQEDTDKILKVKMFSENIFTANSVMKDSLTNLFDLIPNRITLSKAKLLENGLILYGITPNEDVYNFMLAAPLKSIFNRSYSSFFPAQNGWLRFVSTNYIDEVKEEKLDEEE